MRAIGNGVIRRMNEGASMGDGYANNITDWRLATNDTASAVEATSYFDSMIGLLVVGSMIYASLDLDGTPEGRVYMVTAATSSEVTVTPINAEAIT